METYGVLEGFKEGKGFLSFFPCPIYIFYSCIFFFSSIIFFYLFFYCLYGFPHWMIPTLDLFFLYFLLFTKFSHQGEHPTIYIFCSCHEGLFFLSLIWLKILWNTILGPRLKVEEVLPIPLLWDVTKGR
jgi:hypothetical protein